MMALRLADYFQHAAADTAIDLDAEHPLQALCPGHLLSLLSRRRNRRQTRRDFTTTSRTVLLGANTP
jgi:hypothetical protein